MSKGKYGRKNRAKINIRKKRNLLTEKTRKKKVKNEMNLKVRIRKAAIERYELMD